MILSMWVRVIYVDQTLIWPILLFDSKIAEGDNIIFADEYKHITNAQVYSGRVQCKFRYKSII